MGFRTVGDIVVVRHTKEAPTGDEWNAFIGRCRRTLDRYDKMRGLIISEGGGPNSDQRGDVNELLAGRPQRVAVLNRSRWVRGVVTALSWFNPEIRAFALDQTDAAFEHLHLTTAERDAVAAALREITSELSAGEGPYSAPASRGSGDVP